jgi:hypothetical protein
MKAGNTFFVISLFFMEMSLLLEGNILNAVNCILYMGGFILNSLYIKELKEEAK